jgi:hypothetical protein
MLTQAEKDHFHEQGYVIRRRVFNDAEVSTYRIAVDRVLAKCRSGAYRDVRWVDGERDDFWGVNNILHHDVREAAFLASLEHPGIYETVAELIGPRIRYGICTLLVNSERKPYHIGWHRDLPAPPGVDEVEHLKGIIGHVQLNGALYPDSTLYIVPASHLRYTSDAERDVMRSCPLGDMPEQLRVELDSGDVVFYNACLLHKGKNESLSKRQTLHYALASEDRPMSVPPPRQDWLDDAFFTTLSPTLRPMFERWKERVYGNA